MTSTRNIVFEKNWLYYTLHILNDKIILKFVSVEIKKCYCFILYVLISASPLLGCFLVSRLIPVVYSKILALYAEILCYLGFYVQYRTW